MKSITPKHTSAGAFVPLTSKKQSSQELQARIDAVVAKAKANENGVDLYDGENIFRNRLPLRRRFRLRSSKLG
jgi:hypothetical protein